MNATAEAWKPSPLVQFAIQQLLGSDAKHRQDLAELVCTTLGVVPNFWSESPEAPPVNLACVVRLGERAARSYTIAVFDGAEWRAFNGSAVAGVTAWAAIPD